MISRENLRGAATFWLTGLPGAGKTTLARRLESEVRAHNLPVEVLDGDLMRNILSDGLGFTKEDRNTNVRRIGFVCNLLSRNGVFAIAAAISPYREMRQQVRAMHQPGRFVEIFVTCPLEDLIARDPKGAYRKALLGEIPHFTGISDPYEPPEGPDIIVHTGSRTINESFEYLLRRLQSAGYLPSSAQASAISQLMPSPGTSS